jgi:hypothetical protein
MRIDADVRSTYGYDVNCIGTIGTQMNRILITFTLPLASPVTVLPRYEAELNFYNQASTTCYLFSKVLIRHFHKNQLLRIFLRLTKKFGFGHFCISVPNAKVLLIILDPSSARTICIESAQINLQS